MTIDVSKIEGVINKQGEKLPFSGVVLVQESGETVFAKGYGLTNRAEPVSNTINTRFAMASGCKIFTGIAICQLVEKELISFDTLLKDCLDISFPEFDPNITVHHLLTHSSGIPDYFDEEVMDDYEALWQDRPTYTIRGPKDFLPMFQNEKMKFTPGERFSYSNAGFIVLGLIIEQQTGLRFTDYVETHVFAPCGMTDSGYFAMDQLPTRTAYGYIENEEDHTWHTNFFAVPIIGGPDGGAFTTAPDMVKFWNALFEHKLLSKALTEQLLTPHIQAETEDDDTYYGYGVWITKDEDEIIAYYVEGCDPGVAFISTVYPGKDIQITVIGNTDKPTWPIYDGIVSAAVAA